MRGKELRRAAAAHLGHLLPQRHRRARVVAGAGGKLDADAVGLALEFARIRAGPPSRPPRRSQGSRPRRRGPGARRRCRSPPAGPSAATRARGRAPAARAPISCPITAASSSSVACSFSMRPGVDRDLAARHAPGVDLVRADDVDFPLPCGRVGAERARRRDQPARYGAHAVHLGGIAVERALLRGALQGLLVGLHRRLVHLGRGQHHGLLAIDPDRSRLGGLHRLAARQRQRQQDKYGEQRGRNSFMESDPR